jgi:N-acetylmuramoyl-L-alanine amidase
VAARPQASPNHGPRRDAARPDLVVIHYTAMTDAGAALARLCDPASEVSAHYLVGADGTVWALVPEDRRAWHAGAGAWGGAGDVNSRSIGIELDNDGTRPFAAAQMRALEGLLAGVLARWRIPPERVIGHSDMAPARKTDPGRRFDWRRLARAGLSVWPDDAVVPPAAGGFDPAAFVAAARRFGYPDHPPGVLLEAVRLRFRPWAAGVGDARDLALIGDLARRFPVDAGTPGG